MAEEPLSDDARVRAADLFETHAAAVNRALAARFPAADPQAIADATVWTILRVSIRFERYTPARGSVRSYLFGFARRRLAALLRAEHRRRQREQKKAIDPVTAAASGGQSTLEELADRDLAARLRASLNLSPEDERVLDLWLRGEVDEAAYAAALGMADRPPEEWAKPVGRALARLRQRLCRARQRLHPEGPSA
jgi:DNA-directed RNA polymerase specialized sigma24 family protein